MLRLPKSLFRSVVTAIRRDPEVVRFLEAHPRLRRFLARRLGADPFGLLLTLGATITIFFLFFFFSVVEDLIMRDPLIDADLRIVSLVQMFRSPRFDQVMIFVTYLGNWQVVFAGAGLVAAYLLLLRRQVEIVTLVVSVVGGEILVWAIKTLFQRQRPDMVNALAPAQGPSFPSGHAFVAFAFYGLVAWLAIAAARSRWSKALIGVVASVGIVALGFSRVYVGVHWPSDVLASYALGAAWLTAAITGLTMYRASRIPARPATASTGVIGVALLASWLAFAGMFYAAHPLIKTATPAAPSVALSRADFPANLLASAPRFSEDIVGKPMEPINVLLVGTEDAVLETLREAGWQPADPITFGSVWHLFVAQMLDQPYDRAPGTPTFWRGRPNERAFEKPTAAGTVRERNHLHLWTTPYLVAEEPVWVGTAHLDKAPVTQIGVVSPFHDIDPAIDREREALRRDLSQTSCVEQVDDAQVTEPMMGQNALKSPFFTDGKAIVAYLNCRR